MKQYQLEQVKFPIISQSSINNSQLKSIPIVHKQKSPAQSQMIRIIIALLIAIFIYNSSQQTTINYNQIIKNQKMFLVKNIRGVIPTLSGEVYKLKNEWIIVHYENYHQNDSQIFNEYRIQFNISNMLIKNIQCGLLIQYNWLNYSYNIDLQQISYNDNGSIVSSIIDEIINNQTNIQVNHQQLYNKINNNNQNKQNNNNNNSSNINNNNNNKSNNNNQQQVRQISYNLSQQQIITQNNSLNNQKYNNKQVNTQNPQQQLNNINISTTSQISNNYSSSLINNHNSSSLTQNNSLQSNNSSQSQSIKVGITNTINNNNSLQSYNIKRQKCDNTNKYLRQIMKFTSIWTISNHHLYLLMENTHLEQDYYLILKPYHTY